jgi:hypothetical protein
MNSFALARSITSSINSLPTPESWGLSHARDRGPLVEEVRAHDAAVLLGGDRVEAVVGEQIGEKPCRGFR